MSTRAIEEVHVGDMSGCFSTLFTTRSLALIIELEITLRFRNASVY